MSTPDINIHGVATVTYEHVQSPGGSTWTEFSFWDANGQLLLEVTAFSNTKIPLTLKEISDG